VVLAEALRSLFEHASCILHLPSRQGTQKLLSPAQASLLRIGGHRCGACRCSISGVLILMAKHFGSRCWVVIDRRNLCEVAAAGSGRADEENSLSWEKMIACQTFRSQHLTSDCSQSSNPESRPVLRLGERAWRGSKRRFEEASAIAIEDLLRSSPLRICESVVAGEVFERCFQDRDELGGGELGCCVGLG
jgi:hypothetical protein